jgi:hypothetical protein
MLAWTSPWWLLAFAIIPVIWLLHRFNSTKATLVVSTLLFWKPVRAVTHSNRFQAKADPLWMLRALIVAVLVMSLLGLRLLSYDNKTINIWFDDSFSMLSQEGSNTRAELAALELSKRLQTISKAQVKIYSLTDPGYPALSLATSATQNHADAIKHWLKINPIAVKLTLPSRLNSGEENWLITDGADAGLNEWLKSPAINQLIQIGKTADNSAITLLSIRPSLKDPKRWSGIIQVNQFGRNSTRKSLALTSGSKILQHWDLALMPEQDFVQNFEISKAQVQNNQLTANLTASDALPQDDTIELNTANLISTRIEGKCPSALLVAIKSHPFLNTNITQAMSSELTIVCGDGDNKPTGSVIWFHATGQVQQSDQTPVWSAAAAQLQQLYLNPSYIQYFPNNSPSQNAILTAGQHTLITSSFETIHCYLDMAGTNFTKQPEYPVLFAGLIDLALKRSVLDTIQTVSRNPDESKIEPLPINKPTALANADNSLSVTEIAPFLILCTLLLLTLEIWFLRKRR